ncbi:hypothetical protein ACP70R_029687 [Stipagrostis hirtigluma subsp. patula]
MARELITRAAPIMILALILFTPGTQGRTCGTFPTGSPLCNESTAMCVSYCIGYGYATGVCYAGGSGGGLVCACQTPCSEKEEEEAQGGGRSAAGGAVN